MQLLVVPVVEYKAIPLALVVLELPYKVSKVETELAVVLVVLEVVELVRLVQMFQVQTLAELAEMAYRATLLGLL